MNRLGRITLWLFIWPLGLWRSITHSHQKQLDKLAAGQTPVQVAGSKAKNDATAIVIGAVLLVFLVINLAHAL